jgi:hypothetical protein
MWDKIRDLVSRAAGALGIDVPELPDAGGIVESAAGTAEAAAGPILDDLAGAADSASGAVTDTAAQAADSAGGTVDSAKQSRL